MDQTKICKRCVLPESKPDIFLNDAGICNVCIDYESGKNALDDHKPLESDLTIILDRYKSSKRKYDCLVMCSGGKDSTSALYYMVKRYKLNPLAFMFDHGFETEDAIENVKNAVDILGVDFLFFKTDFMRNMFSKILQTGSKAVICHPCSIWYMQLTFDIAARYDIPIIIAGWTKGQSTKQPAMSKCGCNINQPEYISMAKATGEFLDNYAKNDPKYKNFPKNMEEVLVAAQKKHECMVLSPHWFLHKDPEEYVAIIKNELKWKYPRWSYPARSTNCYLNFISVHNSMKYYGYTHYHIEMSKLIREGLLTREQALKDLELNFDNDLLNSIAQKLDYKFE